MFTNTLAYMHTQASLQWMQQTEWPFYYSVVGFRLLFPVDINNKPGPV